MPLASMLSARTLIICVRAAHGGWPHCSWCRLTPRRVSTTFFIRASRPTCQSNKQTHAVTVDCQGLSVCNLRQTYKHSAQKPFAQSGVSRHVVDAGDAEGVANSWAVVKVHLNGLNGCSGFIDSHERSASPCVRVRTYMKYA